MRYRNDTIAWLHGDPFQHTFQEDLNSLGINIMCEILEGRWNLLRGRRFGWVNPTTPIEIENALVDGNWK